MAPSLRDIPGSNRPRKRFARLRERDLWAPPRRTNLDLTPRGLPLEPSRAPRALPRVDLGIATIAMAGLGLVAWMGTSFWHATRVEVAVRGLTTGDSLTPSAAAGLHIQIRLPDDDDRFRATLTFDGVEVLDRLAFVGDTVHLRPSELIEDEIALGALDEGPHRIHLRVGRLLLPGARFTWTYDVDSVPPELKVPALLDPVSIDEPITVRGTLEPGATLRLGGRLVETHDGRFAVDFERPPTGTLRFEATDAAGNQRAATSIVPVQYPSSRGVHVSAVGWANDAVRASVLDLVDRGLIDSVVLDLKDEHGTIGYASRLQEHRRIGAVAGTYDLTKAVKTLQARHVRVIGRIVAFRDPTYAASAWAAGRTDEVLQTPGGKMPFDDGGFANYVHPAVQKYNLDLAVEATKLGVRDILWDYVRRPGGAPSTMVVPNLSTSSAEAIAAFLGHAHEALRARGAFQGATVSGLAASAGDAIAQDVPAMARAVDYLAPTIYPSLWSPGQYGVASPVRQPGDLMGRVLADFQRAAAGSAARFVPWIQDFSRSGVTYGPAEVRAQITGAADLDVSSFFLWNPDVQYTASALDPLR